MRSQLIATFLQKNKSLNLSAIRDEEGVMIKHIQDSLTLLQTGLFTDQKLVIDVGTGSGFPLMPLAMNCPELRFVGIDSVRKKTVAVNEMLEQLACENAKVLRTRIEEYCGEQADLITARAVAYADTLLKWSLPLLKPGGHFLLMKQVNPEEKSVLLTFCKKHDLKLIQELNYQLFEGDIERVIYVIEKGI